MQKFWIAVGLLGILGAALALDAFGFKPSDIIVGGIIGAIGAMTQDFFSKKTPETDAAVARKIDAVPPQSPPNSTETTTATEEDILK